MPKKTKNSNSGLFGCISAPVEQKEMVISKPFQPKLSEEDIKILAEIKQNIPTIENLPEKTVEQQHLLSLMKSIIDFSMKEKSFETISILNKMIEMYRKKNINWSLTSSSQSQAAEQQKKEIPEQRQTATQENHQHFLVVNKKDLNRDRLRSMDVNPVILNNKEAPSELDQIFAKRKEISERKNNDTTEKKEVISYTTNVSPDEQSKLSERAAVEVQLEQKNTDNIAASEQTQNSQDNSFLLQQLQSGKLKLKNRPATEQTNNLPIWVKSDYLDNLNQKKYLQKATQLLESLRDYLKKEDFENYEFDLSEKYSMSQLDEQTFDETRRERSSESRSPR